MKYSNLKKFIYKLDPETAHNIVEKISKNLGLYTPFVLTLLSKKYNYTNSRLEQQIFNTTFQNPIGLAAGFDKNATMLKTLSSLGFGFIEYGTLTPKKQLGNDKPRLFRYPDFNSLQNAMGFNNDGLKEIRTNVEKLYPFKIPLGANIGKNKTTLKEDTLKDYEILIDGVKDISDYIVINISSPNTPGLRDLQNEEFVKSIFQLLCKKTDKPILLKIAPDLKDKDAIDICNIALENGAKGIIATNTTIDYSLLPNPKNFGGISGEVLKEKSFSLFEKLSKEFYGKTTLISVGGIGSGYEAYRRLKAGATLVQLYSSLIFEGPIIASKINKELITLMNRDGFTHISEVIGVDRK